MRPFPDIPFLILWMGLIVAGCAAGMLYFSWPWFLTAFASINAATFFLYGLDKLLAATQTRRVPERALHLTAFLFGSPGALIAMYVFRHKTRKTSFQFVLALLVLLQVAAVFGVFYYYRPELFISFPL